MEESLQIADQGEIVEDTDIEIRAKAPVYASDAIVYDDDGKIQYHYVIVFLSAGYIRGELKPGNDAEVVR